jgi:hypothetical protein
MNEVNPKVNQTVSELGQNVPDNRAVLGSGSSDGSFSYAIELSGNPPIETLVHYGLLGNIDGVDWSSIIPITGKKEFE